jgi:hypothetical protein
MKCKDFQQKLSDYIEGIIPSEERMIIEDHLKSCSTCSEFLADMKRTISYVHDLEDMEPPACLREKVMSRIKTETEPKRGFFQKLFYPLHIKLPLEAVVAALIAVITIYIFKTMQPEMKLAQAPSEHETVIARSPSKVDGETISKKKIASPLARNDRKRLLPSYTPLQKTITSSPPLEKGGKREFEAKQAVPAKKPMIMNKLEEAPQALSPMQRQDEVRPSADAVAKEKVKTEVLSRAAKAKASDEEREVVNVTVLVKDIKTAKKEIETALTHFGGKIIKAVSYENKEIVTTDINSHQFKEFIASLKSVGDVQEKDFDLKAQDGTLELIIEIK